MVLVNKWDLIDKDQNTVKKYEDKIREQLAPFNDVPIISLLRLQSKEFTRLLSRQ